MKFAAVLLPAVFLSASAHALPVARIHGAPITLAHGCHGAYQHDLRGWHRHDRHCTPQRGTVRSGKSKRGTAS